MFRSESVEETLTVGEALGRSLIGGVVVGLIGPLGAGKTHFVKGVARGNGLPDVRRVTSPTFTLVHEYAGTCSLCHIDAYRLCDASELEALGFEEFVRPGAAVVVEWADRVRATMPDDALWIEFSVTGEQSRSLACQATGPSSSACLAAWRRAVR